MYPGLCNCKTVTLPAGSHSTPSHPPAQQSVPVHEDRMSVVSTTILTLKLRRAALSAAEHTPAAASSSLRRGRDEDEEDMSRRSSTSHLREMRLRTSGILERSNTEMRDDKNLQTNMEGKGRDGVKLGSELTDGKTKAD
ncbi:hypothetical protein ACLB2K_033392 [Fragaria x ananassa]